MLDMQQLPHTSAHRWIQPQAHHRVRQVWVQMVHPHRLEHIGRILCSCRCRHGLQAGKQQTHDQQMCQQLQKHSSGHHTQTLWRPLSVIALRLRLNFCAFTYITATDAYSTLTQHPTPVLFLQIAAGQHNVVHTGSLAASDPRRG